MPDHWQTLLEARLPRVASVPRRSEEKLSCAKWVAALDESLSRIDGPVVLVAHSGGVMMVVHGAQRHRRPIKGALLATPADLESPLPEGYPKLADLQQNGWVPTPREPLPFPSIVAASRNDPLASFDRVAELARAWGSRLVDLGNVGHLNPAAGYGEWKDAEGFIRQLD
jgi:predicted alpha/beta hydrolase family esterase